MHSSGLTDAPVSRFLITSLLTTSLLAQITNTRHLFHIPISPLRETSLSQVWWKILIWQLCYTNTTDLVFGAVAVYHLRVVERIWGARKMGVSVFLFSYALKNGKIGIPMDK